MKIINYLADLLFRYQRNLAILAIFLLCMTVSFRFTNSTTEWIWKDNVHLAIILVFLLIVIALIWVQIEKKKTFNLIQRIKDETTADQENTESHLEELSSRQREVFDLIMKGKTNKEIMNELNIELSTLKTHINKLYKTLRVDTRKQLKRFNDLNNHK